jgi:hypothetical protein
MKYFNLFFTQKVINLLPNEYFSLHFRIFETIRNRYCSGFWRFSWKIPKPLSIPKMGAFFLLQAKSFTVPIMRRNLMIWHLLLRAETDEFGSFKNRSSDSDRFLEEKTAGRSDA